MLWREVRCGAVSSYEVPQRLPGGDGMTCIILYEHETVIPEMSSSVEWNIRLIVY